MTSGLPLSVCPRFQHCEYFTAEILPIRPVNMSIDQDVGVYLLRHLPEELLWPVLVPVEVVLLRRYMEEQNLRSLGSEWNVERQAPAYNLWPFGKHAVSSI